LIVYCSISNGIRDRTSKYYPRECGQLKTEMLIQLREKKRTTSVWYIGCSNKTQYSVGYIAAYGAARTVVYDTALTNEAVNTDHFTQFLLHPSKADPILEVTIILSGSFPLTILLHWVRRVEKLSFNMQNLFIYTE